jgi:predicted HTH transcriptional regulator
LIGIKDNGALAGVRSEEEMHMLEAAAQMHCKPEVALKFNEWKVNGKRILEVDIEKNKRPIDKRSRQKWELQSFCKIWRSKYIGQWNFL